MMKMRKICGTERSSPSLSIFMTRGCDCRTTHYSSMMQSRLRRLAVTGLFATGVFLPVSAGAQASPAAPQIVADGFAAYLRGDLRAALDVWLKGSPAANRATVEQVIATVTPIETVYGHLQGYDVLRVTQIGSAVRRVYVVARYERGPLYMWFECYDSAGHWIIPSFLTNTRASEILPAGLF